MSLNNIITSINALSTNATIPNSELNNVVCIDTNNSRIGIKTTDPEYEIDVSGTSKTSFLYIYNNANTSYDISSDVSLSFSKGLITNDISVDFIDTSSINTNIIQTNSINTSSLKTTSFITNTIDASLVLNDISFTSYVDISGNVNMDNSLNVNKGIICSKIFTGELINTSDDRLKHNEVILDNGLNIVRQLVPMKYDKTDTLHEHNYYGPVLEPHKKEVGLIAQDVYSIPDISFNVIPGDSNTPYYINYTGIGMYTISAVKQLDNIINNISNDISNINITLQSISDLSNINIVNIQNLIRTQNNLITTLNNRITLLENKINNI